MRRLWAALIRIAPYLVLGPISGFLVDAVQANMRARRPILAGLYAAVLAEYLIFLGAFASWIAPVALR